ncbi:MAG TPA: Rrf2 family transcriptional regulator [Chitinophagales bacterium]|nr:Rrf2 family transcriptional regulator [Chitinophagales bacterium]
MRTLSKATVYCLRAMIYIASKTEKDKYFNIGEISQELDISYHFLTKTFQTITQAGLLTSLRGPYGGIALAKPAEEIFLIDIIHTVEGKNFFEKCLLGLPDCGVADPCPVHNFWKDVKESLQIEFEQTSLADLAEGISQKKMRI